MSAQVKTFQSGGPLDYQLGSPLPADQHYRILRYLQASTAVTHLGTERGRGVLPLRGAKRGYARGLHR